MLRSGELSPKVGDRIDLLVVDASLASALFHGIPAARLLAHARLGRDGGDDAGWESRMAALLGAGSRIHDRVRRAVGRHSRVAVDERPIKAPSEATVAVLVWAVACDPEGDSSLAEIAPAAGEHSACDAGVLEACAVFDDRLASLEVDKRAPAFEVCMRLATQAALAPMPSDRFHAIALQLEQAEIGVRLFGGTPASIFPRCADDEIRPKDRRMVALHREPLEALLSRDPRQLGPAVWRTEHAEGGANVQLATFLADLGRLLRHPGSLVAAIAPPELPEDLPAQATASPHSWAPPGLTSEWTTSTAAALADALEHGEMTAIRARTSVTRGGEAAVDAIGAEMLRVGDHAIASAVFAEIVARSARPRDILRLVTYFAVAPDPEPAARALGACADSELPRVLRAWLEAMLPPDGENAEDASVARVAACVASLRPYPQLYHAVQGLLSR
jgi:hypothetical protein